MTTSITLATRRSQLALWQAEYVKQALKLSYPHLKVDLLATTTVGDINQTAPLTSIGGKEVFVKELQRSVIEGKADIAVHSVKDLGAVTPKELILGAVLEREDARDVLISDQYRSYDELPRNAIIGTASPRRKCQLLHHNPHFYIKLLRGNVETRLKKLYSGDYDAIILAAAGLHRLKLNKHITEYLTPEFMLPAIGQGAIGLECRANDTQIQKIISTINHPNTQKAVCAERAVNAYLGGDCFTPIAAHAYLEQGRLLLHACAGSLNGDILLRSQASGALTDPEKIGNRVAVKLISQGAKRFITK